MERFTNREWFGRAGNFLVLGFCLAAFPALATSRTDIGAHPSLRLWLKADTLTLADGATVDRWEDQSRSQAHALQAKSNKQPKFRANALNGKPVVVFDGSSSVLRLPHESVIGSVRDLDMFAVFSKLTNTGYDTLFGGGSSGDNPLLGTNGEFLTFYNGGSSPSEIKATKPVPLQTYLVAEYLKEVADVILAQDGTTVASGRFNSPSSSTADGARFIGGDSGSELFDGSVAEIIFFDVALSDDERRDVRCYLANKYALNAAKKECAQ